MKFKEAYEGCQCKRLGQGEAASQHGICDRRFRRDLQRFDESDMDDLLDRRFNEPSTRQAVYFFAKWYRESESNRHSRRNRILNPARLPVPPPRHLAHRDYSACMHFQSITLEDQI